MTVAPGGGAGSWWGQAAERSVELEFSRDDGIRLEEEDADGRGAHPEPATTGVAHAHQAGTGDDGKGPDLARPGRPLIARCVAGDSIDADDQGEHGEVPSLAEQVDRQKGKAGRANRGGEELRAQPSGPGRQPKPGDDNGGGPGAPPRAQTPPAQGATKRARGPRVSTRRPPA